MVFSLVFSAIALGGAFHYHRQRNSPAAVVAYLAVLFFGSGAWLAALTPGARQLDPRTLDLVQAFGIVVALLSVTYQFAESDRTATQEYGRMDWQWFLPFILLGLAIRHSPVTALLVMPILAAVPKLERRGVRWKALLALAVGELLLAAWALSRSDSVRALDGDLLQALDPTLVGWNLAYLFTGRHVGILLWFAPVLLLVASYRRGTNRGWLLVSVALATLMVALLQPYDLRGAEGARLNVGFLPLYGALWFVPMRIPKVRWLLFTAIVAGLFLWPAWLAPRVTAAGEDRPSLHARSLASRLLYETTQENAPFSAEWKGTGVLSRALGPGLEDGDRGPVLVPSAGPAHLMIAAEKPLEAVLLDFGPEAATELRVEGGTTGNTVFRPDGGVRFEIVLGAPDRSHPMWFSPKRHHIYLLEIEMPSAPEGPLPVAIMARPEDALPRSLDPATAGKEL